MGPKRSVVGKVIAVSVRKVRFGEMRLSDFLLTNVIKQAMRSRPHVGT